jgi:hypothetical protein
MTAFKLENQPKIEPGFSTPDNYFDTLEAKVMQSIPEKESKVVTLFREKKRLAYAVAAVLVLALMVPVYTKIAQPEELDATTLENYLSYHSNLNQYDLLTVLEPEDIENLDVTIPVEDEAIEEFLSTNNNVEHYITE